MGKLAPGSLGNVNAISMIPRSLMTKKKLTGDISASEKANSQDLYKWCQVTKLNFASLQ